MNKCKYILTPFRRAIANLLHINTSNILIKTIFQINKIVRRVKLFKIFSNVLMYSLMEDSWIFYSCFWALRPLDLRLDSKNYCFLEGTGGMRNKYLIWKFPLSVYLYILLICFKMVCVIDLKTQLRDIYFSICENTGKLLS